MEGSISFELSYTGNLVNRESEVAKYEIPYGSETKPTLHVFFTHHFTDVPVVVTETQAHADGSEWSGPVKVPFKEHLKRSDYVGPFLSAGAVSDHVREGLIPPSCRLFINVFCHTWNDSAQACRTRAGTAHVELRHLLEHQTEDIVLEVMQNTHDPAPLNKGQVIIRANSLQISDSLRDKLVFADDGPDEVFSTDQYLEQRRSEMFEAINRSMATFYPWDQARWPATQDYMRPIHCPEFRTPFSSIPGSCYTMRTPHSHEPVSLEFWCHLVGVVLDRLHVDAATLNKYVDQQFDAINDQSTQVSAEFRYACRALALMLSVYPNTLCYLDDFSNDKGKVAITEDFKIARVTGADDCEGVARESDLECRELAQELHIPDQSDSTDNDDEKVRLLGNMRRIVHLYVRTMVNGGVTNKKLDPGQHTMTPEDANSHTYFVLIPVEYFGRMCPHLKGHPKMERMLKGPQWQQSLDVLICEGTAPMDPYLRPIEEYYDSVQDQQEARRIVDQRSQYAQMIGDFGPGFDEVQVARRIYQVQRDSVEYQADRMDLSSFYKSSVSLYTDQFVHPKHRRLDFVFVYRSKQTYGVYTNDLLYKSDDLELVPYVEWSEREARVADDLLLQMEPIPRLTYHEEERQRAADVLKWKLKPVLRRQFGQPSPKNRAPLPSRHVNFMVRGEDVNTHLVSEMCTSVDIARQKNRFCGFRVSIRYLGNTQVERLEGDPPTCVVDFDFYF